MPARSVVLVVLVAAVWGVNFVVLHVALDHFPPLLFNAMRFALMAFPAVLLVGRPRVPWRYAGRGRPARSASAASACLPEHGRRPARGCRRCCCSCRSCFTILFAAFALHERPRARAARGRG